MSKTPVISVAILAALIFALVPGTFGQRASVGQSSTLLPDGRTLLLGGFTSQKTPSPDAFVISSPGSRTQKLAAGLNFAREGHTATVLPDGTVFIFGGVGPDGRLVASAELFDPSTEQFSVLQDVFAVPRAFHTATLLTDGTLLLAGGVMAGGQFPDDVQLWDWRTRKALSFQAFLMTPREGHSAALLSSGAVRVSGGTDHFGRPAAVDEIFDPVTRRFRFANQADIAAVDTGPGISESIPADGATDAPISDPIAIRFNTLLSVTTISTASFVFLGPDQNPIQTKVTAAEGGRLAFVVPGGPLQPGTAYVLRINNVVDLSGSRLPDSSISFQTQGAPPDRPGLDWAPNSTWTYGDGATTKFQQLPPLEARSGVTALAGQVLKLNGWPLEHVTLEIEGSPKTRTDSTGRFLLKGLTPGHHVLWIDGSTANRPNAFYGVYPVGVTILPNKTNLLNYTIWMTRLDVANAVDIPSPTTKETVITSPNLPGVELHLPPNTVIKDRYGRVVHLVSITPVPLDRPPFPLPPRVQLPVFFVVQPGGAQIEVLNAGNGPDGGQLVYPNRFQLKPGTPFAFWNYDPAAKGWYIYGQGSVSPDGRSLVPGPDVVIYEFTAAGTGPMTGNPKWPLARIRLSQALNCLAESGTQITVVTRDVEHNRHFYNAAVSAVSPDRLRFLFSEELHAKGILGDHFYLSGSMNFTYNGIYANTEILHLITDPRLVAEAHLAMRERWG